MASQKEGFATFIKSKTAKKGCDHTHTRIPDKKLNIYPGCYTLNESDLKQFYKKYYKHVFVDRNQEYLTEKQLRENGPIMIDFDFRYQGTVTSKQHTNDHIVDAIMLCMDKCKELVKIPEDTRVDVYVMEKNAVNCLKEKNITKDGIHIIIGLAMHKGLQVLLRKKMLEELGNIWDDLPITNSWEDVFDEGVTKGQVNWQVYGSRKPGNQVYLVKNHYTLSYDSVYESGDWSIEENNIDDFNTKDNLLKLSARYDKYPKFDILDCVESEFNEACKSLGKKQQERADAAAAPTATKMKNGLISCASYFSIKNQEMLDALAAALF